MQVEGQEGQELEQEQQNDGTQPSLAEAFADSNTSALAGTDDEDVDAADLEMAAGYAETRGVEPPASTADTDTSAAPAAASDDPATVEALQAEAAKAAEAKGESAGASPQPANAGAEPTVAQVLEQVTALQARLRNAEGHIGGINSTLKQSLATAKAVATSAGGSGAAPSQADIAAAAVSGEKLKQLCEDFPDFGEALKESLTATEQSILAKVGGSIDREALRNEVRAEVMAEVQPFIRGEIDAARAETQVVARYPDFHDRVKTPEFGQWLQKQAPEVVALAHSTKAADAIALIDRHQKHVDTLAAAARKRNRLTNAVLPRGTAQGGPQVLDDDAAMQAGFASVRGAR
jgi:hypothetical protein